MFFLYVPLRHVSRRQQQGSIIDLVRVDKVRRVQSVGHIGQIQQLAAVE